MKPPLVCIGETMAMGILAGACNRQSRNKAEDRERRVVLQRQLGQLENEADRIQDVRDLKRLQRAYGYYIDCGMWSQAADLFEPQGTIEIGLDGVYIGQKRIRQRGRDLENQGFARLLEVLHALRGRVGQECVAGYSSGEELAAGSADDDCAGSISRDLCCSISL
jgi:hypothetical protein